MTDGLEPVIIHIKPQHQRSRVVVDRLTVVPPHKQGNTTLIVIVEHFTKNVAVYPAKDYSAHSLANILLLLKFLKKFGQTQDRT